MGVSGRFVTTVLSMLSLGFLTVAAPEATAKNDRQHYEGHATSAHGFSVGICAIVKEVSPYFIEWIDYHIEVVGFDYIYLYDNSEDFKLERWYLQSRKDPIYGRVEVRHFPLVGWVAAKQAWAQSVAYSECVHDFGRHHRTDRTDIMGRLKAAWIRKDSKYRKSDYLALIDGDEFLTLQNPAKHATIHDVLAEYLVPYGGALVVNWMLYGTSGRTIQSPLPVLKRFQHRAKNPFGVVKSIVKASDFAHAINPHAVALLKRGKHSNDTAPQVRTTKFPGAVHKCASSACASDHDLPATVLLLNHYRYKSTEEYAHARCSRGRLDDYKELMCTAAGNLKTHTELANLVKGGKVRDHMVPFGGEVYDDSAWKSLVSKVPKYKAFDDSNAWRDYS